MIETKPVFMYDDTRKTLRPSLADASGNEVVGHTTIIADDCEDAFGEDPLAIYDFNTPFPYPNDGMNQFDDKEGDIAYFEGLRKIDLLTKYENVEDPPKFPQRTIELS